MRRTTRIISTVLITAGLVVLTDAAVTLAWEEPVSSLYTEYRQGQANEQLEELEDSFADELAGRDAANEMREARRLAAQLADRMEEGKGIGRVVIPAIGADAVVVQGTSASTLQKGPGHYPETKLPGQGSTVAIAGHRTTYLAPFRDLDQLEPGDEVLIELPYGTASYAVEKTRIVDPDDVQIVRDVGRERLVLTACHPLYSAAQRIAVFARLEGIELLS